jgi:hypothetical protein
LYFLYPDAELLKAIRGLSQLEEDLIDFEEVGAANSDDVVETMRLK